MDGLRFAWPQVLWALWGLPLGAAVLWAGYRRLRRRYAALTGAGSGGGTGAPRRSAALAKGALLVAALAGLIVALAGPRWGYEWQEVRREGRDLVIAVDVSRSMLARDLSPNRLERAKREVSDLLSTLRGDRVGLVAFAGEAFVQCPLTGDYGAVRLFMDSLKPDLIPVQGTDMGRAIRVGLKALERGRTAGTQSQAIIVMSDGEDLEGQGLEAARAAEKRGVSVFTLGLGTEEGAPIPAKRGGFKKDPSGSVIVSRPDTDSMKRIAEATGGIFVRSVATDADLAKLRAEGLGPRVEKRTYQSSRRKHWFERFQWFLAAAFVFVFAEPWIRVIRQPRSLTLAAGLAVAGMAAPVDGARASSDDEARQAFTEGRYEEAAEGFEAARRDTGSAADRKAFESAYNKGVALHKAGRHKEAAEAFAEAAQAKDGKLAEKALFNMGNARFRAGERKKAIEAFEKALELDPDDSRVRENLGYVKRHKPPKKKPRQNRQSGSQNEGQKPKKGQKPGGSGSNDESDQPRRQKDAAKPSQKDGTERKGNDDGRPGTQKKHDRPQASQNEGGEGKRQASNRKPDGPSQDQASEDRETASRPDKKNEAENKASRPRKSQAKNEDGRKAKTAEASRSPSSGKAAERRKALEAEEAERILRRVQEAPKSYLYRRPKHRKPVDPPEKDW